jgi:hypothetical protein
MADMIIILILVIILGAALSAMRKSRAKGVNCIGCPDAPVCEMRRKGLSCQEKDYDI